MEEPTARKSSTTERVHSGGLKHSIALGCNQVRQSAPGCTQVQTSGLTKTALECSYLDRLHHTRVQSLFGPVRQESPDDWQGNPLPPALDPATGPTLCRAPLPPNAPRHPDNAPGTHPRSRRQVPLAPYSPAANDASTRPCAAMPVLQWPSPCSPATLRPRRPHAIAGP